MYVHLYVRTYVQKDLPVTPYTHTCMQASTHTHTHTHMHKCEYIIMSVLMWMHVRMCVYMHIMLYTCVVINYCKSFHYNYNAAEKLWTK